MLAGKHSRSALQSHGQKAKRRCAVLVQCAVKSRGAKNVVVSKTLVAKPASKEQVAKLLAEVTSASIQLSAQQRKESGLIVYQSMRDQFEDGTFHVWERFDNNAASGRYWSSDLWRNFTTKVGPHLDKPIAVAMYEWNNGQLGPIAMAEGPKGEGGLDDATGASGAAGGASMKQTSASFDLAKIEHEEEKEREEHSMLSDSLLMARKQMDEAKKQMDAAKNKMQGMFGNMFGAAKAKVEAARDAAKAATGKKK